MRLYDLVAAALTKREQQVAYALLAGKSGREISLALDMKERTVKGYMARLFWKFDIPREDGRLPHIVLAVTLYRYCYHS